MVGIHLTEYTSPLPHWFLQRGGVCRGVPIQGGEGGLGFGCLPPITALPPPPFRLGPQPLPSLCSYTCNPMHPASPPGLKKGTQKYTVHDLPFFPHSTSAFLPQLSERCLSYGCNHRRTGTGSLTGPHCPAATPSKTSTELGLKQSHEHDGLALGPLSFGALTPPQACS